MKITDFTTMYGVITMMIWFLAQTVFSLGSPLDFALNESIAAQQNRTYHLTQSKRRSREIEKTKENRKNIGSVVSEIDREKGFFWEKLRNDSTTPSQQSKSNPSLSDEEIERLRDQIRQNENSTNNASLYDLSTQLPMSRNLTSDNTTEDKANASTTPTIPTPNVTTSPHPEYRPWWHWIGIGIGMFMILCPFVLFCYFHHRPMGVLYQSGQRVSQNDGSRYSSSPV